MPAQARRRDKPYRSHTFDPWPCCQDEPEEYGGRPKGRVICAECRLLLDLGKAVKAKQDAACTAGERQPFWFTERHYAYPYIRMEHRHGRVSASHVMQALYNLVWSVGEPADGQPNVSQIKKPKKEWFDRHSPDFEPWPSVIDKRENESSRRDWEKLIVLAPAVRTAINALDMVIRQALEEAFLTGKERGGSLLLQLASGEKSLVDFEKAVLPANSDNDEE